MNQPNIQNERIKRRYLERLKEAEGFSSATIQSYERAMMLWEDCTNAEDFGRFNKKIAMDFKRSLVEKPNERTGAPLTLSSIHQLLIHLFKFFVWLSGEAGYKTKIHPSDIAYLKLDRRQSSMARQPEPKKYPSFEIVQKVVHSIELKTEIDHRDQALIAFALISGMRDDAIISLPLECVDFEQGVISQNPKKNVRTKFSKNIQTTLMRFDQSFVNIFVSWIHYLQKEKLYSPHDPVFPKTLTEIKGSDDFCFTGEKISKEFWKQTGAMREIFKKRFAYAGVEYYSPHAMRHLAMRLALKHCVNAEQIKAVSQNFGHEHIATSFLEYGHIPDYETNEILKHISFSQTQRTPNEASDDEIDHVMQVIKKYLEARK